jgi:hypothetical protein
MNSIPRHLKIGIVLIAIGGIVTFGYFLGIVGRIRSIVQQPESEANPFKSPAAPLYSSADPPMDVKMFFPAASGSSMISSEQRMIFKSREIPNRAKQILQMVIDGPMANGLVSAIPKDTKLQEVFSASDGTLFVDFSSAISVNHPGGIVNEQATIYSIVDSLLFNLPEVHQVKILVGGAEQETLAGHCLLLLPFPIDLSMTDQPHEN